MFSERPESVVWGLTVDWGNSQSLLFKIFLLYFSFSSGISIAYLLHFLVIVPWSLDILFCFFQSLFSLLFGFEDPIDIFSSLEILSSAESS